MVSVKAGKAADQINGGSQRTRDSRWGAVAGRVKLRLAFRSPPHDRLESG